MHERNSEPRSLDVRSFARDGRTLEGAFELGGFQRLATGLALQPGDEQRPVAWTITGELRASPGGPAQVRMALQARAEVALQCQRCLQPMASTIDIDRVFRFAADEREAERLDEETDDEVLVLEPSLDLHALLEDELILALPLVPRHEECPQPLLPAMPSDDVGDDASAKPNPFAVLAALRGGGGKPS